MYMRLPTVQIAMAIAEELRGSETLEMICSDSRCARRKDGRAEGHLALATKASRLALSLIRRQRSMRLAAQRCFEVMHGSPSLMGITDVHISTNVVTHWLVACGPSLVHISVCATAETRYQLGSLYRKGGDGNGL